MQFYFWRAIFPLVLFKIDALCVFRDSRQKIMQRGALIVFEGLDRVGKSTQCQLLEQKLLEAGHKTKAMKFPGFFW